jgi:hypothetical protein
MFENQNLKAMIKNVELGFPHLPVSCPGVSTDGMLLHHIRDYMKSLAPNLSVREAILSLIERWHDRRSTAEPLAGIRTLLDSIRLLPRSDERLNCMNTFLQTLGQSEVFATFLDMVRYSSQRSGTREQALSEVSRKSSKHAVYGWCGQTRLALSGTEVINSTLTPEPGVQAFLGKTPTSAWSLSMHIWQPNAHAQGFLYGHRNVPNIIAEPPHSHPFDFASIVVIGQLHQSVYAQCGSDLALTNKEVEIPKGRYDGVILEHVHGVWPPHDYREESLVMTLEDRFEMNAGDSYYMSGDTIHDVQIDADVAQSKPAITLFLRSESFVKPHVYMAPAMADFHALHPDLKNQGYPLAENAWNEKLELVADYVRGKSPTLNLSNIVKYDSEYAFFHI